DRAPAVLVHQPELASNASGELSGDRRPDRGDHDQDRPERAVRARPASLSEGGGCVRCRNCRAQHRARRVPWRVELYHLAPPSLTLTGSRSCTYFLTGPKVTDCEHTMLKGQSTMVFPLASLVGVVLVIIW